MEQDDTIIEDDSIKQTINLNITNDNFDLMCENPHALNYLKKKFKFIFTKGAENLLRLLLQNQSEIHVTDIKNKYVKFLKYNRNYFDKEDKLKLDFVIKLQQEIILILNNYFGIDLLEGCEDLNEYEDMNLRERDTIYFINKKTDYNKIRKTICNDKGGSVFKYNFLNADIEPHSPNSDNTLQRCFIQIVSHGVKFDYPLVYVYNCLVCGKKTVKKVYETNSSKDKLMCEGFYNYINGAGESKTKNCWKVIHPDDDETISKECYFYNISYEDERGNKLSATAISFNNYEPGIYDSVLFKIPNSKGGDMFQLIDTKESEMSNFELPEKTDDENYLFTLQKSIDKFILKQTGMDIFGLIPIKCSLILQSFMSSIGEKPIYNVQVVGDPSTGKSTVLKYYGFFLYNYFNLSTNGLSISIPALRGTRTKVNFLGKENNIVTLGYLGTFLSIHIDEASENRELIQNLKSFIYETNYGYDKAGASGIQNVRTAHINLSENLDFSHLGQYIGMIRKAYKNLNIKIGDEEKPEWDESWDFYLPIHKYVNNPYLYKVIKEKRQEFINKKVWWIDGYDYAVHERFPFYFYLVNSKDIEEQLSNIVRENACREVIEENFELMQSLKNSNLTSFFKDLKKYVNSTTDYNNLKNVNKILTEYGVYTDSRTKNFYYKLVIASRIINQRTEITEQDYDLLRWFIEKLNRKIPMNETINYKIEGPPNLKEIKERDKEIDDTTQVLKSTNNEINNFDFSDLDEGSY